MSRAPLLAVSAALAFVAAWGGLVLLDRVADLATWSIGRLP
jgi:hypothetical protein